MNPNTYKRTLYVGNIDETATEELIRAAFIPFGEIVSIDIPVDSFTSILLFIYLFIYFISFIFVVMFDVFPFEISSYVLILFSYVNTRKSKKLCIC
jgi:hypothetical protein